jgi:hypothetical protein
VKQYDFGWIGEYRLEEVRNEWPLLIRRAIQSVFNSGGKNWELNSHDLPQTWQLNSGVFASVTDRKLKFEDGHLVGSDAKGAFWFSPNSVPGHIGIKVTASIPLDLHETLFATLARELFPPDMHLFPRFNGPVGEVEMIVWSALERDFHMFRIGEQAEATAESLAKVLPKFGFQRLAGKDGSPALLGWLNYWSPRAANALGFPDPVKDTPILPLCRQFEDGAWLVKLTADPLDLQRPDHVAALAWAYQRFDKIGRRRTPEQEAAKKAAKQLKKAKEQAELDRAKALDPAFVVYAPRHKGAYGKPRTVHAPTSEDALRVFFARGTKSRLPKPRETLAQLSATWDEMASAMGDPLAAEFVAEPLVTAQVTQPAEATAMPQPDYAALAASALSAWDANVTECENEAAVHAAVVEWLTDEGYPAELAEQAAGLIEPAWAEAEGRPSSVTQEQAKSPLFLAMLNEIRSGGWDIDSEA